MAEAPESFKDLRPTEREALMEIAVMPPEERKAIVDFGKMDPEIREAMIQTARNSLAIQNICTRIINWKSVGAGAALIYAWWSGILGSVISFFAGNPAAAAIAGIIAWESIT